MNEFLETILETKYGHLPELTLEEHKNRGTKMWRVHYITDAGPCKTGPLDYYDAEKHAAFLQFYKFENVKIDLA